jgi:hypothetical protein
MYVRGDLVASSGAVKALGGVRGCLTVAKMVCAWGTRVAVLRGTASEQLAIEVI